MPACLIQQKVGHPPQPASAKRLDNTGPSVAVALGQDLLLIDNPSRPSIDSVKSALLGCNDQAGPVGTECNADDWAVGGDWLAHSHSAIRGPDYCSCVVAPDAISRPSGLKAIRRTAL
jgi:hypothetical protein